MGNGKLKGDMKGPQKFCVEGLVPSEVFRGGALRKLLDHEAPTQSRS